jgi:periplasmic copper chaperone A
MICTKSSLPDIALGLIVAGLLSVAPASAADYTAGSIKIGTPWTRITPPSAQVAGGFMTLTNTGTAPDKLLSGASPVSGRIEVHEMSLDGGIMKMRELVQGLEIKPGETVELKPGSFHIMFMDLKEPIKGGSTVKGTLVFEKAGAVEIEYKVEPLGSKGPESKVPAAPAAPQTQHHHHGK